MGISLVLSGGTTNTDSQNSLGGEASYYPALSGMFDDITSSQARNGLTDYRCVYVINDSDTETISNIVIRPVNKRNDETQIDVGTRYVSEMQSMYLRQAFSSVGVITGGNINITVTPVVGPPVIVSADFDVDPVVFAQNIEDAINTEVDYVMVHLNYSFPGTGGLISFIISVEWYGEEQYRQQNLLEVDISELVIETPGHEETIFHDFEVTVRRIWAGAPIESVASELDRDTTPPAWVTFFDPTIELGYLRPLEYVPIWIRRIVPAGADQFENDGFDLKVFYEQSVV